MQVVAIPTIAITYAIDSYKPISGEIMAIATVAKDTFGVSQNILSDACERSIVLI